MGNTNYLGSMVKILEKPIHRVINEKIMMTECRAQLAQVRNKQMVNLVFWGNLARDVVNYYQVNDYVMIEGYISIHEKANQSKLKKAQITVLKIYPMKH